MNGCTSRVGQNVSRLSLSLLAPILLWAPICVSVAQPALESPFGILPDGRRVHEYTLRSKTGMQARVISLGATLRSLQIRTRRGEDLDVVLGYDSLAEYLEGRAYFGATIGRYANRIAHAAFELDGKTHNLSANSGANSLHGGAKGFDRVLWVRDDTKQMANGIRLRYESADGEEGYPGRLTVWVTYEFSDTNELEISYDAQTSKPTVINLTNHSYFNLNGAGMREVTDQRIAIRADRFTPVDADGIPTGPPVEVQGTDYDFRKPLSLQAHLQAATDPVVIRSGGYDVNFVLSGGKGLEPAARIQDVTTGLTMDVLTTQPGLQLFTPNFPREKLIGKGGRDYGGHSAICLETQHFPDSPHQPGFPSTVLRPGERFHSETRYRFSTD
jgi:aldose 1-epimerase